MLFLHIYLYDFYFCINVRRSMCGYAHISAVALRVQKEPSDKISHSPGNAAAWAAMVSPPSTRNRSVVDFDVAYLLTGMSLGPSELRVTGGYELPNLSAGN